jgi:hypothetical protein
VFACIFLFLKVILSENWPPKVIFMCQISPGRVDLAPIFGLVRRLIGKEAPS